MALIKCTDCGKEISASAIACPGCGKPIKPTKQTSVFWVVIKVILTLIAIAVFIFVVLPGFCVGVVTNRVADRFEEAKKEEADLQIQNFESALKLFRLDNGFFPETGQGLDALINNPKTGKVATGYSSEAYLEGEQIPTDPWENEYIYIGSDELEGGYEVISKGPDGELGTEDDIKRYHQVFTK